MILSPESLKFLFRASYIPPLYCFNLFIDNLPKKTYTNYIDNDSHYRL